MNDAIDLRDFPFMPLHIARLQKSKAWLRCKRRPELAFYMLNLWMRAWHEVPAGSIENDDDVLADAAMCEPRRWAKIKDEVLLGWVDDGTTGRLIHPVVTELAEEAWTSKQKQRQRTEGARQARLQTKSQSLSQPLSQGPPEQLTMSVTENATDIVTGSKGEGQGEREGEGKKESPSLRSGESSTRRVAGELSGEALTEFEAWYAIYPRKKARGDAERAWPKARKLASLEQLIEGAKRYAQSTDPKFYAYPASWLNGKQWLDEPDTGTRAHDVSQRQGPKGPPPPPPDGWLGPDESVH